MTIGSFKKSNRERTKFLDKKWYHCMKAIQDVSNAKFY